MVRVIARYRIKHGTLSQVEETIREFLAAVAALEPGTQSRSYRLGDGREFMHLTVFSDESAHRRHKKAAHTLKFLESLRPNCEKQPLFIPASLVGETPATGALSNNALQRPGAGAGTPSREAGASR